MANALEKRIANQEEIQPSARVRRAGLNDAVPRPGKNRLIGFLSTGWRDAQLTLRELPLMLFTLLAQMAAGLTVTSLVFGPSSLILLIIGALLGLGLLNSLLHLGTPLNAWRTLNHLGKSWLSREILMAGLFGASWLTLTGVHWLLITEYWLLLTLHALTALLGLGLVYAMAQVYRIKAVPAWNTWRTEAAFLLSAGTLGLAGIAFWTSRAAGWISLSLLLAAEAAALLSDPNPLQPTVRRFRVGLILLALAGALTMPFVPEQAGAWLKLPIFLLILVEECAGRWRFYQHLEERCL
jgi:DMSO reductase anchor subunit